MADIRWEVYIRQSDGTDFSVANEDGAAVRLRTSTTAGADSGEYTGNVAGSGDFGETGSGLWNIQIDSGDSGWYLVQSYTDAEPAWASVNGFAPIYIARDEFLPLSGGTMSGNMVMDDNSITGVNDITFADGATGTINSIIANRLVDKGASAEISGAWSHTGFVDITGSKLKIGGTVVTTTAAQLNMLAGLTDTDNIPTLQKPTLDAKRSTISGNTTLTIADAGHIPLDTSGGTYNVVMPLVNESSACAIFNLYVGTGGNDITIIDNAANGGFVFMTASDTQTKGDTITTGASVGDYVTLMSNGGTTSTGFWTVLGGIDVAIS